MCCTNSSNFVADLHALNGNCSGKDTLKLGELHHPVTSIIYITIAVVCVLLSLVTHFKYNSVTVLNLKVRSNVISNVAWIAYFTVLFLRSVVGAVIYGITSKNDDQPTRLTVYFIADGALKSLEGQVLGPVRSKAVKLRIKRKETGNKTVAIATSNYVPSDVFYVVKYTCQVLCLSWALHHQWKYRSAGFIQQEINSFNSEEYSASESDNVIVAWKLLNHKAGVLFVAQFLLAILFLILLEALNASQKTLEALYWTYIGLLWTQCITTFVWMILIATNRNEEGPTLMTKILLVIGVVIILPGDIPSFVWSFCINCKCIPWAFLTYFDFALFLSIPSVIIFFHVLRTEFLRLDQEAQYSVLAGEVDSLFSVHSQSTERSRDVETS